VSSAAVLKSSKHPKEAQQLLAYMASEEGQRVITQTTAEYPLHKGMESDRGLKPFSELQAPKSPRPTWATPKKPWSWNVKLA
jgi:iron(III) transport system substrate-binding protein